MKKLSEVRQIMAEKGWEMTPAEVQSALKHIAKASRRLKRLDPFEGMVLYEKQAVRQALAEQGEEITMDELEEKIELIQKIKNIPFEE